MLVRYIQSVEDGAGNRIEGATVYLVPYESGQNESTKCDISDAIPIYPTDQYEDQTSSMVTGSTGTVLFWVEEGDYTICVTKGIYSYTIPKVCMYCPASDDEDVVVEVEFEPYKETFGDGITTTYTITHNGNTFNPDVDITSSDNKDYCPEIVVIDANSIQLNYASDCAPLNQCITIDVPTITSTVCSDENDNMAGLDVMELVCKIADMKGLTPTAIKVNGTAIVVDEDGYFNITTPELPNLVVDGETIDVVDGAWTITHSPITLTDGGSNVLTGTYPDYTIAPLLDCDGNAIDVSTPSIQTCVTLPECGYTGDAICEDATLLTVINESADAIQVPFTYPSGITGQLVLNQTAPNGTMALGAPNVAGNVVTVPITVSNNGEVNYNILIDKTDGPTADSCTAAIEGVMDITGLVGTAGSGVQIQKGIGGAVITTNMADQGANVYDAINGAAQTFNDVVDPQLFGGDPSNLLGSTHDGSVQVFDGTTQTFNIVFTVCYREPVVAQVDVNGTFLSAVDSSGNAVAEADYTAG